MPELGTLVLSLLDWYARNARDLPWRQTTDPYAIWISEVMLQQTQVKTVIPSWHRWMKKFPTINALARSKSDTVLKCWEGLGYYSRARNLHAAAQTIVSRHGGIIPRNPPEVLALRDRSLHGGRDLQHRVQPARAHLGRKRNACLDSRLRYRKGPA